MKKITISLTITEEFIKRIIILLFITSIFYGIVRYSTTYVKYDTIKTILPIIEPYFLATNVVLIFSFLLISLDDIIGFLKKINKRTWIMIFLIFFLGLFIRLFITAHTHRVYFDEDIYLDIGKEILVRWRAALCNNGNNFTCYEYDTMKWSNGHTFFLAIIYLFFGLSESLAFNAIAFISSVSIILIFLIGYLLKDEKYGLFSALIYTLIPVQIQWSGTVAAEPTLAFFTILSMFFIIFSLKIKKWSPFFLGLATLAYAIQIKAESIALLPVAIVLYLLFDNHLKTRFFDNRFIVAVLMLFILITPYLIHIVYASKVDTWGSNEGKFGLKFAKKNIPENLIFFINGYYQIEHPLIFSIFAVIGFIFLLVRDKKTLLFLFTWFSTFFLLYGFFYAGSTIYGADVRYMLSVFIPFALFAGYGLFYINSLFNKVIKNEIRSIILIFVLVLVIFYFYIPTVSMSYDEIMEANQARTYHEFVVNEALKLDKNCHILSHTPSIFLIIDRPSLQTWFANNDLVMRDVFNRTDCVIFDYNYWCNTPDFKEGICKDVLEKYSLETINSITVDSWNFTMYKIKR